jgi:hypothetical protein
MASEKKVLANRLNARLSTGPRTPGGKRRSRRNALKHGLTARSVVEVFEDDSEFRSFAGQVASAYPAPSPVARELVYRLIGLLWRLRRAQAIETGLLAIQGKLQRDIRISADAREGPQQNMFALLGLELTSASTASEAIAHERARTEAKARAFLRLCNINGEALDRLGRYETALWRQAVQTIFMLEKTNLSQALLPAARN